MNKKVEQYSADTVRQITGLYGIRKRPSMYIGSTSVLGVNVCLREATDNSVDEFVAGVGKSIEITIFDGKDKKHKKGWTKIVDHGRGMPTEPHKEWKNEDGTPQSTLTGLVTRLHCGGKFGDANSAFKISSGLHGCGTKCITALSEEMVVTVRRYGKIHQQKFGKCEILSPLEVIGECEENDTGTTIEYLLDKDIFKQTIIPNDNNIATMLDEITALNPGLTIEYENQITGVKETFYHEEGIKSYIDKMTKDKEVLIEQPFYIDDTFKGEEKEIKINVCFTYDNAEKTHENWLTFANNVNTHFGGYHLSSFRTSLINMINDYAMANKLISKRLETKYIMENIYCIISVMLPEAEFEGQTKEKLGSQEVEEAMKEVVKKYFEGIKKERKADLNIIVDKAIKSKQIDEAARKARNAARASQKISNTRDKLPGKLTDCSSKTGYRELLLTEGNSAAGSAKAGRYPKFQAILPLRGKILNTEKSNMEKMSNSDTIKSIVASIGTGIGDKLDIKKIRYDKIIIMTDADVDGSHIRILILTLLYNHMRKVVEEGYVYASVPPLFRLELKDKTYEYVKDDLALVEAKKKYGNKIVNIQRFKG